MAGHSKWANIQHRKGAQDSRRGKVFNKIIRELTTAARAGGVDLASNSRLRLAVDKAKAASMPKDTMERAIKRGSGEAAGEQFQQARYEGYGPNGVAVMIECLTDNRNRTVSDIRYVFARHGGNLGAEGSVAYLFNQVGILSYSPGSDEGLIMDAALDAGAEDVIAHEDGSIEVLTDPALYEGIRAQLAATGLAPAAAEITMRAATAIDLDGEPAESMLKMLEALEDLDDVQNVYTNANIADEILARV